jgi:hypothetical protein
MRYYARACPPSGGTEAGARVHLFNWFLRARDSYVAQPRLNFEAITFGLAVLFGLLVMPAFIYLAGRFTLDAYANGGVFALYGDFYKGLFEPRLSNWIVLSGPFVFLSLFRIFRLILRKI